MGGGACAWRGWAGADYGRACGLLGLDREERWDGLSLALSWVGPWLAHVHVCMRRGTPRTYEKLNTTRFIVHRYLEGLFALAHDSSNAVRREVCVGLVQLLTLQPDRLQPFLYQVIEYMLQSNEVDDEGVALEVSKGLEGGGLEGRAGVCGMDRCGVVEKPTFLVARHCLPLVSHTFNLRAASSGWRSARPGWSRSCCAPSCPASSPCS